MLPAASRAVTVSTLIPGCSAIPDADQLVVPAAMPLPPRSFTHETWVIPMLSVAVPLSVSRLVVVVYVPPEVGAVIEIIDGVPPTGMLMSVRISACDRARL